MLTPLFKRWRRETTPVPLDGRWWIYHVQPPPGTTAAGYVVSLLSPDTFKALGHLPARTSLGGSDGSPDGPIEPASFTQNDAFIDLLHSIIQTCTPTTTAFQDAARQEGEGWVYVLDARTPDPTGRVQVQAPAPGCSPAQRQPPSSAPAVVSTIHSPLRSLSRGVRRVYTPRSRRAPEATPRGSTRPVRLRLGRRDKSTIR